MGEISLKCKRRRNLEIYLKECSTDPINREGGLKKELYSEHLLESKGTENLENDDIGLILADMQAFDHLLKEDLEAIESSESEVEEDEIVAFGEDLLNLLSDDEDGIDLKEVELEKEAKENTEDEEDHNPTIPIKWKTEPDEEVLDGLIDIKVVKLMKSNEHAIVENLESGESSFIKLNVEDCVVTDDFEHEVHRETFMKHLYARAEEAKLQMLPKLPCGKVPDAPFRKAKRGTVGISYKLEINELEEMIAGGNKDLKRALEDDQSESSSDAEKVLPETSKKSSTKSFRHYRDFIRHEHEIYDPTVLSGLLSLPPTKKLKQICTPSLSDYEQYVKNFPFVDTSVSDGDEYSENLQHKDVKVNPKSSALFNISMPLME